MARRARSLKTDIHVLNRDTLPAKAVFSSRFRPHGIPDAIEKFNNNE
jgi:hypothetical protein